MCLDISSQSQADTFKLVFDEQPDSRVRNPKHFPIKPSRSLDEVSAGSSGSCLPAGGFQPSLSISVRLGMLGSLIRF